MSDAPPPGEAPRGPGPGQSHDPDPDRGQQPGDGRPGHGQQSGYAAPSYPGRPLGTTQRVGTLILLVVVSLGIYYLVWVYRAWKELHAYRGGGIEPGMGLLLALFGASAFLFPRELEYVHQGEGQPCPIDYRVGFWVILPVVGYFVWLARVQDTLNRFCVQRGAPEP